MNKKQITKRFFSLIVILAILMLVVGEVHTAKAANRVLIFPVAGTWYICQGYNNNAISHYGTDIYALDFSISSKSVGSGLNKGCDPLTSNSSKDQTVYAPADGTITHYRTDMVLLNLDTGGCLVIGHLGTREPSGKKVKATEKIGTLSEANSSNGKYSHLHIAAYPKTCWSNPVPFTDANNFRFLNAGDLNATGGISEHRGKSITGVINPMTPKCTVPIGSFCGEYYNGTSLSGNAVFTQNTGSINYNWGNSGPGNGIGNDNFSVRWQGSFGFDSATYTFNATSDDGINLYVDNVLQINAWKEQASTTYTKDVTLSSGNHTIKIEYFEKSGGAVAQVSWVKKLVPTYGSVWVSQSTYPTITQGGTADVWVKFKNMGNTTWYNYGSKRTLLGTLHPTTGAIDYNSPFVCSPGWVGSNRPVVMSEGSVAPEGTGTFAFRLCAPSNLSPGTYRVAVAPLVDSVSWMKPPTFVYWDVKVNAKSTPNLAQGRSTWATSQESSNYPSSRAVDGNRGTRWSSRISSTLGEQWLTVDLGSTRSINQIVIRWEAAYARNYFVGYSTASNCSAATYSGWNYTATSREDKTISFGSVNARCVGILMRQRAPGMNNFSVYEVEVYKK